MKLPKVVGLKQADAEKAIRDEGIIPRVTIDENITDCEPGTVIQQANMSCLPPFVRGKETDESIRFGDIVVSGKQAKPKPPEAEETEKAEKSVKKPKK